MNDWLCFLFFFVGGVAMAIRGWATPAGYLGVLASVGAFVTSFFKDGDTQSAVRAGVDVARDLHLLELLPSCAGGFIGGLLGVLLVGSAVVFLSNLSAHREAGSQHPWSLATRRATYFLSHGVTSYLAFYDPDAVSAREAHIANRVDSLRLYLEVASRVRGVTEETRLRESIRAAGHVLLSRVFKPERSFRLAVFKIDGDSLRFWVTVDQGDWTAYRADVPLPLKGSFLGEAIAAGKPMIYPREKKRKKGFVDRPDAPKSFVAIPLPIDPAREKWGGLTIDHTGDDKVFDSAAIEAAGEFARFVDLLHGQSVGGNDEPRQVAP